MNEQEKKDIIERISRRYAGSARLPSDMDEPIEHTLQQFVSAGASRFGVRVDDGGQSGISACDLAPPMARLIDHTALKPETTVEDIRTLCDEARRFCFASVCINPCYVELASGELSGSSVATCTVIGFPLGASRSETKAREAELAVRAGAGEVDMVMNIGLLKSGDYDYVEADIRAVVDSVRSRDVTTKVILETALLTNEEKVIASVLAQNAGADFIKTSTGFSRGGATASDVALMRRVAGRSMGVKASGGIRSAEDAEKMIAHGATRIGASASVAIVKGVRGSADY